MAFRGLVRSGIPQLNPGATVQEVASSAYAGGASSTNIVTNFNTNVLPAAPDVMVACYGLNDADGAIGSAPNVAAATYKSNIQQVVTLAQSNNIDVILLSPFRPHPFYPAAIRIDQYRQAMAELATTYGAGFADLLTDWDNQAYKGLPPFAELHNNHNHPGVNGHRLAADLLLQFFNPSVGVSEPVAPPLLTNEYRIQPNPFTRSFNIDGHQGPARQAMLYDRSGRMVRTFMLTAAATTCVVPDNREHIYFMKISGVPGCMRLMRIEE
jgi:lysophospholipase L1-like esterase